MKFIKVNRGSFKQGFIMKLAVLFISSLLFLGQSQGMVLSGFFIDSTSQNPVEGAKLTFRVVDRTGLYPTTYSDSMGFFQIVLSVEKNYPLQIFVEKSGYLMKKIEVVIAGDSIDIGRNFMVRFVESTISFCGIVVDSVSHDPVGGIWLALGKKNSPSFPFQTDKGGLFFQTVTISNDPNAQVFWMVSDSGYYSESGHIIMAMDSVRQTIIVNPTGSLRLEVRGKVIDSITRMPIENAKVVLTSTYHDAKPDSLYTTKDGSFAGSVQVGTVSSAIPAFSCQIISDGYIPLSTYLRIGSSSSFDLGDLALLKGNVASRTFTRRPSNRGDARDHHAFTLNGRILPDRAGGIKSLKNRTAPGSQVLIITGESGGKSGALESDRIPRTTVGVK